MAQGVRKYYYEIKALQKGSDMELRFTMHKEIQEVIDKSIKGEIGWGDFCKDIIEIAERGYLLGKYNWKQ